MKNTRRLFPTRSQLPGVYILHGEAANITSQSASLLFAGHGRESHKYGKLLAGSLKQSGRRDSGQRIIVFEVPVHAVAAGVNHTLWNAFMIEVEDFPAKRKILEKRWPTRADAQRVLIAGDRRSLLGCQSRTIAARGQVQFATRTHIPGSHFSTLLRPIVRWRPG